jgi:glycosyltransferase involved in cell wall biosynthesis
VGEIRPDHCTRLRHRIATHGLENAVDVTGFVALREYQTWINRSACAVQLREHSAGEGSTAVGDALAAGVPVVTNIPSCLELPDGTLERLVGEADAEQVAIAVGRLLDDPARRQELHDGALRYASSWSVDDVASRLIDIARADGSAPSVTAHERAST